MTASWTFSASASASSAAIRSSTLSAVADALGVATPPVPVLSSPIFAPGATPAFGPSCLRRASISKPDRVEPLIDAVDIDLGLDRRAASGLEDEGALDHVELGQGDERHDPERHHADEEGSEDEAVAAEKAIHARVPRRVERSHRSY